MRPACLVLGGAAGPGLIPALVAIVRLELLVAGLVALGLWCRDRRSGEHRLVLDDRPVCLLDGPAGWGEYSPLPGYPCDPAAAWHAAAEPPSRAGRPTSGHASR